MILVQAQGPTQTNKGKKRKPPPGGESIERTVIQVRRYSFVRKHASKYQVEGPDPAVSWRAVGCSSHLVGSEREWAGVSERE